MKNLAGEKRCDEFIKDELERAGIEIVNAESKGEVPYSLGGKLENYTFRRAWYYWVVLGDTPMNIANKIYDHPEGKVSVRAGGHCGCEPPETQSSLPKSSDGLKLITQKDIDRAKKEYPELWSEVKNGYRVATKEEENNMVVNCYHIDSQAGLLLFALIVKGEI